MSVVNKKIYLAAHGVKLVAGPAIVAAVYFPHPISHPQIIGAKFTTRKYIEEIDEWLSLLEEDKDYYVEYERIEVKVLEEFGYQMAVSRAANRLAYKLQSRMGLSVDTFVLCDPFEVWGSLYGNYVVAGAEDKTEAYFADTIAKYFSMWWMQNYYHRLNRHYEWDTNYGYGVYNHLTKILEIGPDWEFHRSWAVKNIAKHWLHMIRRNDFWALSQPWAWEPPLWWTRQYRCNFTECLNNKEVTEVYRNFHRIYPVAFIHWMRKEMAELEFPPELIEISTKSKGEIIKETQQCKNQFKARSSSVLRN